MAQREIRALLERAIDGLPEAFRTVVVARPIEGMSIDETAELYEIRPETVKTRLHRARKLLKDELEKRVGPVLGDAFPCRAPLRASHTERRSAPQPQLSRSG